MTTRAHRIKMTATAAIAVFAPLIPFHQGGDTRMVVYQPILIAVYAVRFLIEGRGDN